MFPEGQKRPLQHQSPLDNNHQRLVGNHLVRAVGLEERRDLSSRPHHHSMGGGGEGGAGAAAGRHGRAVPSRRASSGSGSGGRGSGGGGGAHPPVDPLPPPPTDAVASHAIGHRWHRRGGLQAHRIPAGQREAIGARRASRQAAPSQQRPARRRWPHIWRPQRLRGGGVGGRTACGIPTASGGTLGGDGAACRCERPWRAASTTTALFTAATAAVACTADVAAGHAVNEHRVPRVKRDGGGGRRRHLHVHAAAAADAPHPVRCRLRQVPAAVGMAAVGSADVITATATATANGTANATDTVNATRHHLPSPTSATVTARPPTPHLVPAAAATPHRHQPTPTLTVTDGSRHHPLNTTVVQAIRHAPQPRGGLTHTQHPSPSPTGPPPPPVVAP